MKKLAVLIFLTISICAHAYDPHHLGKDMDLKDPFQVLHYFQNIKSEKRTADDKKLITYALGLLNQEENKSLGLSFGGTFLISFIENAFDPHDIKMSLNLNNPDKVLGYYARVDKDNYSAYDKQIISNAKEKIAKLSMKHLDGGPSQCSEILVNGIFNSYNNTSQRNKYELIRDYLCKETDGSSSNNTSLSAIIDSITGKAGYKSSKEWYEKECRDVSNTTSSEEQDHLFIKEASVPVVSAWSKCVQEKNNGLSCWAKETDDIIKVIVEYGYSRGNLTVKNFNTHNLKPLSDIDMPILYPGRETFMFAKEDLLKASSFVINARNENFKTSCEYIIGAPKKPKIFAESPAPTPPPAPPIWCAKVYEHAHYGGIELKMDPGQEVANLTSRGLNDRISAIIINTGCYFLGWQNSGFTGGRLDVDKDKSDLLYYGSWNDVLSSVKCTCN